MGKMGWGEEEHDLGGAINELGVVVVGEGGALNSDLDATFCGAWAPVRHRMSSFYGACGRLRHRSLTFCGAPEAMRHRKWHPDPRGGPPQNFSGAPQRMRHRNVHFSGASGPNAPQKCPYFCGAPCSMRHKNNSVEHALLGAPQNPFLSISSFLVVLVTRSLTNAT